MKIPTIYPISRCPFCGGNAALHENSYSMLCNEFFIQCEKCGAKSGSHFKSMCDTVKAWNRRFKNGN